MPTELLMYAPLFLRGMFYVLLLCFSVYGIFLGHHWLQYGTSKQTSTLAIAIYLLGGAVLFLTLAGTIRVI